MSMIEPSGPGWDYPADEDELDPDAEVVEPDFESIIQERQERREEDGIERLRREGLW